MQCYTFVLATCYSDSCLSSNLANLGAYLSCHRSTDLPVHSQDHQTVSFPLGCSAAQVPGFGVQALPPLYPVFSPPLCLYLMLQAQTRHHDSPDWFQNMLECTRLGQEFSWFSVAANASDLPLTVGRFHMNAWNRTKSRLLCERLALVLEATCPENISPCDIVFNLYYEEINFFFSPSALNPFQLEQQSP